jgi:LacI family transcriptional regulator
MIHSSVGHSGDVAPPRQGIPTGVASAQSPGNEAPRGAKARITLRDIASDASVSRATVSLVLRDVPVVAQKTREKVLRSMSRLGYVYHRGAASLRTQRTHAIGLIVTDITNPFFAEIIVAIENKLGDAGYVILLGNSSETVSKQQRLLATMQEYPADGVLLCPATDRSAEFTGQFQNSRIPIVLFARNLPGV